MTTQRTLLLISIILILLGCEKKQSELEFEQSVVYKIFPALMDSLHFDFRLKPPRPPRPVFNEKGEIIGTDTTGIGKVLADYKKRKAELKADSVKLVIAINDSVYSLEKRERNELLNHFSKQNLSLDTTDLSSEYKIDLKKLIADKKLEFKYLSEFPKASVIWKNEYDFHLSGTTGFSRIQFDSTKSFGILRSGMGCGKLCGFGVRVFIRKENGKWVIDEIITTEIS
ncbi:hypothetical protein ACFSSB_03485 [Lacinutrix gracilariae]|uniref:Lipoprotein n=1 Tax=Lacinutrix gracilariae TaxID=1747198 RepID=A0ABW5JY21_9FLAO